LICWWFIFHYSWTIYRRNWSRTRTHLFLCWILTTLKILIIWCSISNYCFTIIT